MIRSQLPQLIGTIKLNKNAEDAKLTVIQVAKIMKDSLFCFVRLIA
jgi:hypothetical protein